MFNTYVVPERLVPDSKYIFSPRQTFLVSGTSPIEAFLVIWDQMDTVYIQYTSSPRELFLVFGTSPIEAFLVSGTSPRHQKCLSGTSPREQKRLRIIMCVSEVINVPRSFQLQLNLICLPCFKSRLDRMNGNKLSMRTFITGWHVMLCDVIIIYYLYLCLKSIDIVVKCCWKL